jgi:hypothetical protein
MRKILLCFSLILLIAVGCNKYTQPEQRLGSGIHTGEDKAAPVRNSLIFAGGKTISERIKPPPGFKRIPVEDGSFAIYLRNLPLKPQGSPVKLYDGRKKARDVHEAVIDMDIGNRDLQQCADAVIRLRAEYFFGQAMYNRIHFNFTNGFTAEYSSWMQGNRIAVEGNKASWVKRTGESNDYKSFRQYLDIVFSYAGSLSLSQEMKKVPVEEMKIGDVFIEGGSPGHCVIVMDMAINKSTGKKLFMIAQSYMPAQDIHILKNLSEPQISPWYSLDFGDGLITPEWDFSNNKLMRFAD